MERDRTNPARRAWFPTERKPDRSHGRFGWPRYPGHACPTILPQPDRCRVHPSNEGHELHDRGQVMAKREAAARARRLAGELQSAEDRERALQFADELEAEAAALEHVERERKAVQVPPTITRRQVQQGLLLHDKDKKP